MKTSYRRVASNIESPPRGCGNEGFRGESHRIAKSLIAVRTEPEVERRDHGPLARKMVATEDRHRSRPQGIPAAMEKDHDRAGISAKTHRCPHVEIEAVLVLGLVADRRARSYWHPVSPAAA
jgi:hypothetical protein